MPPYELTTIIRRETPHYIGPPERRIPLPLKLKIHTSYTSLRDGLWVTHVIGVNPNGRVLVESCASLEPADMQHNFVVDLYRGIGYEVVEHTKPLTPAELGELEELLKGIPGLDEF